MKRMYLVISCTLEKNIPAGIFGYPKCEDDYHLRNSTRVGDLSEEDQREVFASLSAAIGDTPARKLWDGKSSGLGESRLFNRRAARNLVEYLGDTDWNWRVIEVGNATPRDMRPVIGWKLVIAGTDTESIETDPAFGSQRFATRKAARDKATAMGGPDCYKAVPVYGAWRCDYSDACLGALRFRTKQAAENFNAERGGRYTINLHTEEVPEDQLYVP